jgi:hypothetical protein
VQVDSQNDDSTGELVLTFRNSGTPLVSATLQAFDDPSSPRHASNDPFSCMRTGLRFASRLVRMSRGSIIATCSGDRKKPEVTITVRLPRKQVAPDYKAMVVLPDGSRSVDDLPPTDILSAIAGLPKEPGAADSPKQLPRHFAVRFFHLCSEFKALLSLSDVHLDHL